MMLITIFPLLLQSILFSSWAMPTAVLSGVQQGLENLATGTQDQATCQALSSPNFLVFSGGGGPSYNEIALEKNVLYFQRTLKTMGYDPAASSIFFANGTDGKATVRYLDPTGRQRFKVPQIPYLQGASTPANLQRSLQQIGQQPLSQQPLFFYFTGHGILNRQDANNNAMMLWRDQPFTVQQFAGLLDRLPSDKTVVTVMTQCYSGSFANVIYRGGNPRQPLAQQSRCGFFATIKTLPSVGCTPAVNEADYRDYSSSFFAGLSGRSRTGKSVASADYNQDGRVSYAEAHAFAKVDEQTTDLPISTAEAWLQRRVSPQIEREITAQPIAQLLATARPEQRYVVTAIARQFGLNPQRSFSQNIESLPRSRYRTNEQQAYLVRLHTELINIRLERQLRQSGQATEIATLDRLLRCENGSWSNATE